MEEKKKGKKKGKKKEEVPIKDIELANFDFNSLVVSPPIPQRHEW